MFKFCAGAKLDFLKVHSLLNSHFQNIDYLFFCSGSSGKVDVVGSVADTSWEGSNVGCTGGLGDVSRVRGNSFDSNSWESRVGDWGECWEVRVSQGRDSWEVRVGGQGGNSGRVGGEWKSLRDVKAKGIRVRVSSINRDGCSTNESGGCSGGCSSKSDNSKNNLHCGDQ